MRKSFWANFDTDKNLINKILKEKKFIFGKDIIVKFKRKDGSTFNLPAKKGTVFYELKDVKDIIKILNGTYLKRKEKVK